MCVRMEDLHILIPTLLMVSHVREREEEEEQEEEGTKKRKRTEEQEEDGDHNQPEKSKAPPGGREGGGGVEVKECEAGPSQPVSSREAGTSGGSCVSLLFHIRSKQGAAFRNVQTNARACALTLSFVVKATRLGDVQVWDRDPWRNRVEERETKGTEIAMDLQFVDSAARWFPVLQPGSVYRLTARSQDVDVLSCSCVPVRGGVSLHSNPVLLIKPEWRIQTVKLPHFVSQPEIPKVMSICEVLHTSSNNIVSFYGVISERITVDEEETRKPSAIQSLISNKDSVIETCLHVRLTLQDVASPYHTLDVYLDLSHNPYTPGLIPGATVYLYHFERKVSAVCNVYCKSLPTSEVTVAALGELKPRPPPPIMNLHMWASVRVEHGIMGRVRAHVQCLLSLNLQWTCCLCGSVFKQAACTRRYPPCDSTSTVFQADAKVAMEDGTGEAQVWFPSVTIANLLLLSESQWEALQRRVRVRGHVRIYARGNRLICDVNPDHPLVVYLCWLCSGASVCRCITITCKLLPTKPEEKERNIRRRDQEVLSKFQKSLQLQCSQIHP